MSITAQEVIEKLCNQIKAVAEAARLSADVAVALDDVYDAIEVCMRSDCGAAGMADVYAAILESAVGRRIDKASIERSGEGGAYVYFIKRQDGLIKIGYSHNPKARLSQLKQQHQCDMEILAATVGARELEKSLHDRFSSCRVSGEWFRPADDLMAHISSIRERIQPSLQFH
ncbi:GIY-YIG nuclease family protein [Kerstersia gyiorum]|uniref:GIY-YIG nuclease family protein n=1 Tax=Kerstersia gyiorum TaxID=206506 RepID=UPI0039EB4E2B